MRLVALLTMTLLVFPTLAWGDFPYPGYCGPILKTLSCTGTQSGVQYDLFLTDGPDTNGCVVFDYGEGETNIYSDSELIPTQADVEWDDFDSLSVGFRDDSEVWHDYMSLERVEGTSSFRGHFNYVGFTFGHQGPGDIGAKDPVECR